MTPRYSHPDVTRLWSPEWTYNAWLDIETRVLAAQRNQGLVDLEETDDLLFRLTGGLGRRSTPLRIDHHALAEIAEIEAQTQHDVAAFLQWLRAWAGPNSRWLHFGLTSSDLVETAQAMRFAEMRRILGVEVTRLVNAFERLIDGDVADTIMVGRTHGQPAEPTSVRARAASWFAGVAYASRMVLTSTGRFNIAKLSGPVGTFAHNPPQVEDEVAGGLGLEGMGGGATQVVPRVFLAAWANAASMLVSAIAKVGVDVRLMSMVGEAHEAFGEGQVGSSAMPHKRNPVKAERLSGMARLARGYASMLQDQDLWLERDISHSSVERVAVPDLWHVLLFSVKEAANLLNGLAISDRTATRYSVESNANELWSHRATLDAIRDGESYESAREFGREVQVESYDILGDAAWFLRHYPKDGQ